MDKQRPEKIDVNPRDTGDLAPLVGELRRVRRRRRILDRVSGVALLLIVILAVVIVAEPASRFRAKEASRSFKYTTETIVYMLSEESPDMAADVAKVYIAEFKKALKEAWPEIALLAAKQFNKLDKNSKKHIKNTIAKNRLERRHNIAAAVTASLPELVEDDPAAKAVTTRISNAIDDGVYEFVTARVDKAKEKTLTGLGVLIDFRTGEERGDPFQFKKTAKQLLDEFKERHGDGYQPSGTDTGTEQKDARKELEQKQQAERGRNE